MWEIRTNNKNQYHGRGFTLIEMLVTIGIMATITALGFSVIGPGSRQYARDTRRQADLESIRSALEMYRNDHSGYPGTATWKSSLTGGGYMSSVPQDPLNTDDYSYTSPGTCGNASCYSICTLHMEKVANVCLTNP